MDKLQKSAYNLIFSALSQLITMILGILLPRIVMVGYGSEVNGLLNSVTQLVAYLVLFEAGIQSVATKSLYATVARNDRTGTNAILAAVHRNYKRVGCLYCLGLLILSASYPLFVELEGLGYGAVFLVVFFSGFANVISFFFQGKYRILLTVDGKEYILTNLNTITTILNNLLKILLLSLGMDVYVVVILSFFVSLIQTFYITAYIRKKYPWIDLNETPDLSALNQSSHAMIHQISGLVFSNTDVLLLTLMCDLRVVSVYSVYKLILGHIASLLTMPFNSCTFALGQAYNLDRERYKKWLDGVQVVFAALVFSVFTVAYRLLLPFIGLYTEGVTDANYVDRWLPLLFILGELLNLIRVPTRHTVNCAGHFKQTVSRTILETGLNLSVSVVGVAFFGIYGALLGTIVALAYRSVDFILYANRVILKRNAGRNLLYYLVNGLLMAVLVLCFAQVPFQIGSWGSFVLAGLLFAPISLGLFAVVNCLCFRRECRFLLSYLRSRLKK